MNVTRKTEPEKQPVNLVEVKNHLNIIDDGEDDALLTSLIVSARRAIEDRTGRILIDTTFTQSVRCWAQSIELLRGGASTINSIVYDPEPAGSQVTVNSAEYVLHAYGDGHSEVVFYDTFTEPELLDQAVINRVHIEFVAGYGDNARDVPEPLRQAILYFVAHLYENRTPVGMNVTPIALPFGIESLCNPYIIHN